MPQHNHQATASALPVVRGRGRPPKALALTKPRTLEERALVIIDLHGKFQTMVAQTALYAVFCGLELLAAKVDCPYGDFGLWIEEKCGFSRMTAYRYMQAADRAKARLKSIEQIAGYIDVAPSMLSEESRVNLFEEVKRLTDGKTLQQLLFDFGGSAPKPAAPPKNPTGRLQDEPTTPQEAQRYWKDAIGRLVLDVEETRWFLLVPPADLMKYVSFLRKTADVLEQTAAKG